MKAEHINAVLTGVIEVLKEWLGEDFVPIEKSVINSATTISDLSVLIGVKGNLEGNVILSINDESAKNIAYTMTGGFVFNEIDEMLKSAIGELCNTMMGRVCMKLSELGQEVDITPPVVIQGRNVHFSVKIMPLLKIKFKSEKGNVIAICVALK